MSAAPRFVSFDPLRTGHLADVLHAKSEHLYRPEVRTAIERCDAVLFPERWQLPVLHGVLRKHLFPSFNACLLGHNKVDMTRAVQWIAPENLPETFIGPGGEETFDAALEFASQHRWPIIGKEIRSAQGIGVHLLHDADALRAYLRANEVAYLQEKLPIDRDLRIVRVGDRVVDAYWRVGSGKDFRNNVSRGGAVSRDAAAPQAAIELADRIGDALGLDHVGFDIAVVDGHPYFFEFNVRFGTVGPGGAGIDLAGLMAEWLERTVPRGGARA